MKQVLLTMMMAGVTLSHAAPLNKKKAYVHEEHKLAHEIAWQKQNARMAAKGTATMRRLVATTYTANGVLIDTNAHIYSGGRGSTHTVFPESYYDRYSMTGTEPKAILCDTSIGWSDNGGLLWDGTSVYTYDAANNTTKHYYSSPYFMLQHEGVYNSSNKLVQVTTSDTFGGTALLAKTRMYIIYDGNGRRIQDSTVMIATGTQTGRRVYYYDTAGNMEKFESYSLQGGSTLQLFYRTIYRYDNLGRVLTESNAYDPGNGLTNNRYDSFAYIGNAMHPVHHRTATWDANLQAWDDYEILEYTLNAQQEPDTYIIYRHINQWDTIERDVYYYDTHGLIVKSNGFLYMGNGQYSSIPYDQNVLYYEEYDPATVTAIGAGSRQFVIAPNPAHSSISFKVAPGFTSMQVMNTMGQIVVREEGLYSGSKTIDLSELPAGNYVITLHNPVDNAMVHAKFVKQ
ncbi:MAG TPA: T9SS type A sorting domain-containing protein [Flavipsychrobacter sp.]